MAWKQNKYRAKKTVVDGITFDSKREAKRYEELRALLHSGEIDDLELQPPFVLVRCECNGVPSICVGNTSDKKKLFTYKADFQYIRKGQLVIEDSKGFRTPIYRLKKKIVEWLFDIEITEV